MCKKQAKKNFLLCFFAEQRFNAEPIDKLIGTAGRERTVNMNAK